MDFYFIYLSIISILVLYIAYCDIISRKVKNSVMGLYFILSIIFFVFFHEVISLKQILILAIVFVFSLLLFENAIWGAADGKFFISTTIILLSYESVVHFFEYLFNVIFLFAIFSFILGLVTLSIKDKKKIIFATPITLFLFQGLVILAIIALLLDIIIKSISDNIYILVIFIFLALVINKLSKRMYKRLDVNTIIVIGFLSFSIGLFKMFAYYPISLIGILFIKSSLFISSEIATKSLTHSKKGYQPPFIAYMAVALIIELIINQTLLLFIIHLF